MRKRGEIGFGLARQVHEGEEHDLEAQRLLVDQRPVAGDDARLLQRAHAAQAGRRGHADAAGQLDIGHPPVRLELADDLQVDIVEA